MTDVPSGENAKLSNRPYTMGWRRAELPDGVMIAQVIDPSTALVHGSLTNARRSAGQARPGGPLRGQPRFDVGRVAR
jgi:hypothetical protein